MTIEHAIQDRIDAAISAATVFQLVRQQHADLPVIRVQLIDQPTFIHLRGGFRVYRSRLQVDIFTDATTGSDPYTAATDLADDVDDTLMPEPFIVDTVEVLMVRREDRRAMTDASVPEEVRISSDYITWHRNL